jgi:hypothetical protein
MYTYLYVYIYLYIYTSPLTSDDDDDIYLDKLQTKGVKKSILYMRNVD